MLQYNDKVRFNRNFDTRIFRCISDEFNYHGKQCVILEGYSGEVGVEHLDLASPINGDKYEVKLGEDVYYVMERIDSRTRKEVFRSSRLEDVKKVCFDLNNKI